MIVINLTIKNDEGATILVKNRLLPAYKVDNGESPHAECCMITCPRTLVIWAPMTDDGAHASDKMLSSFLRAFYIHETCNATHTISNPSIGHFNFGTLESDFPNEP
jgi:hypothetical protein